MTEPAGNNKWWNTHIDLLVLVFLKNTKMILAKVVFEVVFYFEILWQRGRGAQKIVSAGHEDSVIDDLISLSELI